MPLLPTSIFPVRHLTGVAVILVAVTSALAMDKPGQPANPNPGTVAGPSAAAADAAASSTHGSAVPVVPVVPLDADSVSKDDSMDLDPPSSAAAASGARKRKTMDDSYETEAVARRQRQKTLTRWAGESLVGVDLSGRDLSGFDFTGCDLSGATLGARLDRAMFCSAKLIGATVAGINFSDLSMHSADFFQADLTRANCRATVFGFADLTGANLTGADLSQANLCGATLKNASLAGANVHQTVFLGVGDLSGADLSGLDLANRDLRGAPLRHANLTGVNLSGAKLAATILIDANLTRANLAGTDLTRTHLRGATLAGSNLANANLAGLDLTGADLTGANLTNTDLTGANLTRAKLGDVIWQGTNLTRANLSGANLWPRSLSIATTKVTNYDMKSDKNTLDGIAIGADGNPWFYSLAYKCIGRLERATGKITLYKVPGPSNHPTGLVAGPDGNLWFADRFGATIWRICPNGVLTPFPLTAGLRLNKISAGPDRIWFATFSQVGYIRTTPDAATGLHEHRVFPAQVNIHDLAADRAGNVVYASDEGTYRLNPDTGAHVKLSSDGPAQRASVAFHTGNNSGFYGYSKGNPTCAFDAEGQLWMTHGKDGVFRKPMIAGSPASHLPELPDVLALQVGSDHTVWFIQRHRIGSLCPAPDLATAIFHQTIWTDQTLHDSNPVYQDIHAAITVASQPQRDAEKERALEAKYENQLARNRANYAKRKAAAASSSSSSSAAAASSSSSSAAASSKNSSAAAASSSSSSAAAAAKPHLSMKQGPAHGMATLLLVEADEGLRTQLADLLSGQGYSVLSAQSPEQALALQAARAKPIDLVLVEAPGLQGGVWLAQLQARQMALKVVYLNAAGTQGSAAPAAAAAAGDPGPRQRGQPGALLARIRQALDHP